MIVTPDKFQQSLGMIRISPVVSLDTETTGLGQQDKPFALIIATDMGKWYFDNRILTDAQITEVVQSLAGKEVRMQNAKFDMRMCQQIWGTFPKCTIKDTEVLGRLVRNDHLQYSLAAQAKRYGMEKSEEVVIYMKKHKLKTYDQVPVEIMAEYALMDARITYDLVPLMEAELDINSRRVWLMEQELTPVCFQMERNGLMLDLEYTRGALAEEERLILEAKSQFLLASGVPFDNKKTTLVQVFKNAGEIIPKTEKGNDQLTDAVLESFSSPVAKIVQKIRTHEKRASTYYSSFLSLVTPDGFIHPDMRQAGTATGRFSYREPNLQNMPKDEDSTDKYVVRGCFKPRPGYVFVAIDYKQQEYRLMLAYAKHKPMIEAVMGGADVHQATADLVGISRTYAKTLNFAILYGAGADKLAGMLSIKKEEALRLRNKYFTKLLEVEKLIFDITTAGKARGYVYNWLGRKLHINHPDFAYALANHIMQGGGADICRLAMLECATILRNYDARMVLQVHDALYFEMKESDMPVLIPKIESAMEKVFPAKNGMEMRVDTKWSAVSLAERDLQKWQLHSDAKATP